MIEGPAVEAGNPVAILRRRGRPLGVTEASGGVRMPVRAGNASTVHIAEGFHDYGKGCVLGVYDTDDGAHDRILAINEDREKWGFNRFAISSWMAGEALPAHKRWLYPAGAELVDQNDW